MYNFEYRKELEGFLYEVSGKFDMGTDFKIIKLEIEKSTKSNGKKIKLDTEDTNVVEFVKKYICGDEDFREYLAERFLDIKEKEYGDIIKSWGNN